MGRKSALSPFAQIIQLPKGPAPQSSQRVNRTLFGLCLLMMLPTFACVGASFWRERKAAQAARVLVPIQKHHWKEYWPEEDSGLVDLQNSENLKLWNSALERGEARLKGESVKRQTTETIFWLATRLSEQELARAYYMQANVLYLGFIQGRYRVYVDGELTTWGSLSESTHPVTLSFPLKRLQEGEPLSVAIEITQTDQSQRADVLGGPSGEGFVTPEIADDLIQARHWETELEPLISATAFGILGSLLFFSWLMQRRKQEYAYFAALAYLQACMHVCEVDFVQQMVGSHGMSFARLSFLLWEGTLAMMLGFAIARTRSSWMIATLVLTTVFSLAPFAAYWFSFPIGSLLSWQKYLFKVFVPLAYGRGALACLIQWHVLSQRRVLATIDQGMSLRIIKRRRDLQRMGFGLLFVGALYAVQAVLYSTTEGAMGLFRLSHFLILLACYAIGVIENRLIKQQERVLQFIFIRPTQARDMRKVS